MSERRIEGFSWMDAEFGFQFSSITIHTNEPEGKESP